MLELIQYICDTLARRRPVAVATIIAQQGSSPRGPGSKMVVHADGSIAGTVGGGLVEARTIEAARTILSSGTTTMLDFDLSGDIAGGMDMVCGGQVKVLIEDIAATAEYQDLFDHLAHSLRRDQRVLLVRDPGFSTDSATVSDRFVLHADGSVHGRCSVAPAVLARMIEISRGATLPLEMLLEGRSFIVEPFQIPETVYLFGAGHVSRQVAVVAKIAGFKVVVMDDRPEFANRERFPGAYGVHVIRSFESAFKKLFIDPKSYLVIVTRGHLYDQAVLEQALQTRAGYIGMIGSRRKMETLYRSLMSKGVAAAALERVFCPIGLDIGAQTPEEIAVSIVAELVAVRSGMYNTRRGGGAGISEEPKISLSIPRSRPQAAPAGGKVA
jgi:xanthine dehydrogenase accessory factor